MSVIRNLTLDSKRNVFPAVAGTAAGATAPVENSPVDDSNDQEAKGNLLLKAMLHSLLVPILRGLSLQCRFRPNVLRVACALR